VTYRFWDCNDSSRVTSTRIWYKYLLHKRNIPKSQMTSKGRAQVVELSQARQGVTSENVEIALVEGYTGDQPQQAIV